MLPAVLTAPDVFEGKLEEYIHLRSGDHRPNVKMAHFAPPKKKKSKGKGKGQGKEQPSEQVKEQGQGKEKGAAEVNERRGEGGALEPSDDPTYGVKVARGKYFAAPPTLTHRQKELYGLVQYSGEGHPAGRDQKQQQQQHQQQPEPCDNGIGDSSWLRAPHDQGEAVATRNGDGGHNQRQTDNEDTNTTIDDHRYQLNSHSSSSDGAYPARSSHQKHVPTWEPCPCAIRINANSSVPLLPKRTVTIAGSFAVDGLEGPLSAWQEQLLGTAVSF